MKKFIVQWWLAFAFGLVTSIFGLILKANKKKLDSYKKEQIAIKLGIQALLRNKIQEMYIKYMEQGYIPIYAREDIDELAKQYYNLGGNGIVHDLMDKLRVLPTEPKDKEV